LGQKLLKVNHILRGKSCEDCHQKNSPQKKKKCWLKVPETPEPLSGLPTKIALESGMPHRYLFYKRFA